jgi:broad specificity phosphatase PhoE
MKFAKIYLVRHGEVENKKNIIYGYRPLKLSKKGEKEAKGAGLFLKDKNIAAIFSSPQKRAEQTAKIISRIISGGKLKIQTEKNLRESGLAHFWQGLTGEQIRQKYSKQSLLYQRQPAKLTAGESLQKMSGRMLKTAQKGIKKYPSQNFVLVSHRDPILAFLLKASKRSFNDLHKIKYLCETGSVLEADLMGRRIINKSF